MIFFLKSFSCVISNFFYLFLILWEANNCSLTHQIQSFLLTVDLFFPLSLWKVSFLCGLFILDLFHLIKSQVLSFTCARDSESSFILNIWVVLIFLCFSCLAFNTHCGAVRGVSIGGGATYRSQLSMQTTNNYFLELLLPLLVHA